MYVKFLNDVKVVHFNMIKFLIIYLMPLWLFHGLQPMHMWYTYTWQIRIIFLKKQIISWRACYWYYNIDMTSFEDL